MNTANDVAVLTAVRRWGGHSLAYSTLQPGMLHFGEPSQGYVACRRCLGHTVALGDPLCPRSGRKALLRAFVETMPRPVFMQVLGETAAVLRTLGFRVTPVGVESEINVDSFGLGGKRKADLRHYRNRAREGGVLVHELEDSGRNRRALDTISREWLRRKSLFSRELSFLARPYVTVPEPDTRLFAAEVAGQTVAFVVLDPMFQAGTPVGYAVTILRHRGSVPEGTVDAINLHVIDRLREEGVPVLSLGVSPFRAVEEQASLDGVGAPAAYWLFRALRRWGTPIYHFKGLVFHKSRYRAREVPVYVATRGPMGLLPLYAAARACRML